jgi:lauroyl/myristoyl acyltransferase
VDLVGGTRERLALLGYSGGWTAVRRLPEGAAYAAFRRLADATWSRRGRGVRRLEANLARALGASPEAAEVREVAREGLRSYFRYWCDAFRLPDWDRDRVVSRVQVEHGERLLSPLAEGRGVVVALPHMANWDHAGAWACLAAGEVTTVVERLRPEALFERFVAYRSKLGMDIVPLTGGSDDVFGRLARAVQAGRIVPLLADRDLSGRGVQVRLLGEPALVPAGPAVLAARTGAPLLAATLRYEGEEPEHRLVIRFSEDVSRAPGGDRPRVGAVLQSLADEFTAGIRAAPQDWHMLQRVFVADLGGGIAPSRRRVPA